MILVDRVGVSKMLSSAARPMVWRVLEYGGELLTSSHLRDSALGDVDQVVLMQSDSNLLVLVLMTIERCTRLYWFIIVLSSESYRDE